MKHWRIIDTVRLPHLVAFTAFTAITCSACTPGPDYVRPAVETPATYRFAGGTMPTVAGNTLATVPDWWRGFGDAELDALVSEGLIANNDLRIATARVARTSGALGTAKVRAAVSDEGR